MMRTCLEPGCGVPFEPRNARDRRCPAHRRGGRDQASPTTRVQRDGGHLYERNRAIILQGNPPCFHCGCPATTADHFPVPARMGGSNDLGNLVPACGPCNLGRQGGRGVTR